MTTAYKTVLLQSHPGSDISDSMQPSVAPVTIMTLVV